MKAIVQRSLNSYVVVKDENGNEKFKNEIKNGFVILLGVKDSDTQEDIEKLTDKIVKLRVFSDENGKMNLDISKVSGEILLISQFTLFADIRKGNRPSFIGAGEPSFSKEMYEKFKDALIKKGVNVKCGEFGADMLVSIENDGPVTIIMDSDELLKKN